MNRNEIRLSENDRRLVGRWAAECAERVLMLIETRAPADARPRDAIDGIRAFAQGERRTARLRSLAWAAHAAERSVLATRCGSSTMSEPTDSIH